MGIHRAVVAKLSHIGRHPRLGIGQTLPQWLIKKTGYCDFANESVFDSINEEVQVISNILYPNIREQDWYWNSTSGDFQQTAP